MKENLDSSDTCLLREAPYCMQGADIYNTNESCTNTFLQEYSAEYCCLPAGWLHSRAMSRARKGLKTPGLAAPTWCDDIWDAQIWPSLAFQMLVYVLWYDDDNIWRYDNDNIMTLWWQYGDIMTRWRYDDGDNMMRSFYLSSLSNPGACPSQPGVEHRHLRGGEQQLGIYLMLEV